MQNDTYVIYDKFHLFNKQVWCGGCETSEKCVPGNLNGPLNFSCEKWQWEEYECDGCKCVEYVNNKVNTIFNIWGSMFSFFNFCGIVSLIYMYKYMYKHRIPNEMVNL